MSLYTSLYGVMTAYNLCLKLQVSLYEVVSLTLCHLQSGNLSSQHPGSQLKFVHMGVRIFFIFWFSDQCPLYKILLHFEAQDQAGIGLFQLAVRPTSECNSCLYFRVRTVT